MSSIGVRLAEPTDADARDGLVIGYATTSLSRAIWLPPPEAAGGLARPEGE